jgi:NitT/TauT family transport system substrate-binding protein
LTTVTACGDDSGDGSGGTQTVTIGYQSKTINTVTAGTLMRELGYFEEELETLSEETGVDYEVEWQDYASGPPITAEMIAGNVDIGSMGDYPLLVNGAESQGNEDARSEFVSVTGYNLRGSLNAVVVPMDSEARTLEDLEGEEVSTSVGSTAHGNFVAALDSVGSSVDDVDVINQDPPVGMTALESGNVAALAQFVPFPEVAIYNGIARKLVDLGDNEVPTFHAVVLREKYADEEPEVVDAFLTAQNRATDYIHENPMESALTVSEITELDAEVVYLFNGPGGIVTFDPTIKEPLVDSLGEALPFLEDLGALQELDVDEFTNDTYLREVYGDGYDEDAASTDNPSAVSGTDEVCETEVDDPMTASEAWFEDQEETVPAATPTCLLRLITSEDADLRVAYVPDAATGTKMFAEFASWVDDPAAEDDQARFLPFATLAAAENYATDHPSASVEDFETVLAEAGT